MIRLTEEDPNAPPPPAAVARARLRAAAQWAGDAGKAQLATTARALAGDAAATPYRLALACSAIHDALVSSRTPDQPIDGLIEYVAREVECPGLLSTAGTRFPDDVVAALVATRLLDDVLLALRLTVAEDHGAVIVTSHGRAVAAMPADEWRRRLRDARKVPT